jgi:hypothetical protein
MNNIELMKRIDLAAVLFMKDMSWYLGTQSFMDLMAIFNTAIEYYKADEIDKSKEMFNELFQYQDISGYEIEQILFPDPDAIFYGEFSDEFVKAQELGDDSNE